MYFGMENVNSFNLNMLFYPIVYSRTYAEDADYRAVVKPGEGAFNKEILFRFYQQLRSGLNEEGAYGELSQVRWIVSAFDGMMLFGVCGRNESLGLPSEVASDVYGRSVRAFYGIAFVPPSSARDLLLPYDLAIAHEIFARYVKPVWMDKASTSIEANCCRFEEMFSDSTHLTSARNIHLLNCRADRLRTMPHKDSETEDLIASAGWFALSSNISLITGLNCVRHARQGLFMNATCLDADAVAEIACASEETKRTFSTEPDSRRKGVSPVDIQRAYSSEKKPQGKRDRSLTQWGEQTRKAERQSSSDPMPRAELGAIRGMFNKVFGLGGDEQRSVPPKMPTESPETLPEFVPYLEPKRSDAAPQNLPFKVESLSAKINRLDRRLANSQFRQLNAERLKSLESQIDELLNNSDQE